MQPIDVLSCLLWWFASRVRLRLWSSRQLDFRSLSFCLPPGWAPAFMASPWHSWVGGHCSLVVRCLPLIQRSILVPMIQCPVDALFAALLTRSSWCHAPSTFGVARRCPAPADPAFMMNYVLRVCEWVFAACFLGSWPHALAHRKLPLVTINNTFFIR